jgi:hypothetical protein
MDACYLDLNGAVGVLASDHLVEVRWYCDLTWTNDLRMHQQGKHSIASQPTPQSITQAGSEWYWFNTGRVRKYLVLDVHLAISLKLWTEDGTRAHIHISISISELAHMVLQARP